MKKILIMLYCITTLPVAGFQYESAYEYIVRLYPGPPEDERPTTNMHLQTRMEGVLWKLQLDHTSLGESLLESGLNDGRGIDRLKVSFAFTSAAYHMQPILYDNAGSWFLGGDERFSVSVPLKLDLRIDGEDLRGVSCWLGFGFPNDGEAPALDRINVFHCRHPRWGFSERDIITIREPTAGVLRWVLNKDELKRRGMF